MEVNPTKMMRFLLSWSDVFSRGISILDLREILYEVFVIFGLSLYVR